MIPIGLGDDQGFFSEYSNYSAIFKMPLYLVLKGSKKIFGAFGAEKHPIYPIFCVFIAFLGHFFPKMAIFWLKKLNFSKFRRLRRRNLIFFCQS